MSKNKHIPWIFLFILAGSIDLFQIVIDLFGVGVAINVVLDPIIGVLLVMYFQLKGFSVYKHPSILFSLIGAGILGVVTGGIAPAWVLDIWYIRGIVMKEEKANKAREEEKQFLEAVNRPLYEGGKRRPIQEETEEEPANVNGRRAPRK